MDRHTHGLRERALAWRRRAGTPPERDSRTTHTISPRSPQPPVIPHTTVAKARGSHLRVHFKHVREVVHTINGWPVAKAKQFLEDVLQYKRAVPFTRFVPLWLVDWIVLALSCRGVPCGFGRADDSPLPQILTSTPPLQLQGWDRPPRAG